MLGETTTITAESGRTGDDDDERAPSAEEGWGDLGDEAHDPSVTACL